MSDVSGLIIGTPPQRNGFQSKNVRVTAEMTAQAEMPQSRQLRKGENALLRANSYRLTTNMNL